MLLLRAAGTAGTSLEVSETNYWAELGGYQESAILLLYVPVMYHPALTAAELGRRALWLQHQRPGCITGGPRPDWRLFCPSAKERATEPSSSTRNFVPTRRAGKDWHCDRGIHGKSRAL